MPKKKSIKLAAQQFIARVDESKAFVGNAATGLSDAHVSRIYDGAIIRLYRDFETLVLEVLVGAINNDTSTLSETLGVDFPKHLTDEVCLYIITGPSYFDFKGRSGLISRAKQYVPENHYLVGILKASKYRTVLDRLCALRNFAAHSSPQSRKAALAATGHKRRIGSAGSWLKSQDRFTDVCDKLKLLAEEIESGAPH